MTLHPRYRYYWKASGWGPLLQVGATYEQRSYPGGYPVVPTDTIYAADLGFGVGFAKVGALNVDLNLNASYWAGPGGQAIVLGSGLGLGWIF